MSYMRLPICQVDDGDTPVSELARVDLPPMAADVGTTPVESLEAQVARVGPYLLGRLCALQ